MNNIEAMANMIEEEGKAAQGAQAKETGAEQPAPFTEERAAEMIETAVQKATGDTTKQIAGLSETLAAIQQQLEILKPKGETDNA